MGYIYLVTNKINDMKYVGQSIQDDIYKRWNGHRSKKRTVGKVLHNAYNKYGIDNFDYKIICICFDEDTDKYEEEYIKKYNTVHPNGYNLLQGGKNRKHNEETKRHLSEIMSGENHPQYGTKLSEEHKKKISKRMKGPGNPNFGKRNHRSGKKFTEEEIQKRLDRYKEHPETKEQISNSLKKYYKNCYEKGIKTNGKTVKQYDLDGNFIREYMSISEAGRAVNIHHTVISKACERVNGTSGGYRWTKE